MNYKKYILITMLLGATVFAGCTYDKSELKYARDTSACDTAVVTYRGDVVSVLSRSCYSCHSGSAINGAGLRLDNYNDASDQGKFGSLLQVIEHVPGYSAMPKNGTKISNCDIAVIRTWIRNGAPDN